MKTILPETHQCTQCTWLTRHDYVCEYVCVCVKVIAWCFHQNTVRLLKVLSSTSAFHVITGDTMGFLSGSQTLGVIYVCPCVNWNRKTRGGGPSELKRSPIEIFKNTHSNIPWKGRLSCRKLLIINRQVPVLQYDSMKNELWSCTPPPISCQNCN